MNFDAIEDANALAAFAEKLAEKPSTLKAVIAVLRDILNKLKGLVAGAEAQRLANMLSKFEELYRASASRTTEGQTQSKEKYSLSDKQAAIIIEAMKANAVVAPQIELTPENWVAEFGAEGVVSTPIGEVKMSSNQYQKMEQPDRRTKLGMVKPTLTNPDVIIEEPSKPKDGKVPERNSSYVFVKAFTNADGTRDYMFTSISNLRDGIEIVMSKRSLLRLSFISGGRTVDHREIADNIE